MGGRGIWERFLDIIYPTDIRCIICNEKNNDMNRHGICKACESSLPFITPPNCLRCGKSILYHGEICSDCIHIDHAFSEGMSIFEFNTEVKELIHRYKYRGQKYLSKVMIEWMAEGLNSKQWDFQAIVPVPLHPTRQRQRGFNQAELLARGLGRKTGVPLADNVLLRVKNTPHQTRLNRDERQENLMNAFEIRSHDMGPKAFQDKCILLVDDVYTTGSTAHQCSRVLLENGAEKVYVITLAIGTDF